MFRPTALYIGVRYTRARRRNQYISFISLLSLLGSMLGVAVLIVVISVMNGFEAEIRHRTLQAVPHILVTGGKSGISDADALMQQLRQTSGVNAVAPYIGGNAMLSVPGVVRGAALQGIAPDSEQQVSSIAQNIEAGQWSALRAGDFGIVLGKMLASHLGVYTDDKVVVTLPQVAITPLGAFPRMKRFTVVGIFEIGAEQDATQAFIHIEDASRLFRSRNAVHGVRVKADDIFAAPALAQSISNSLPEEFSATDWSRSQGGLFSAIKMEKTMVGFLLMIVVAVAAFNIVSIVVMMVADKRPAIAVLRTMGMRARSIVAIFITQGSLIGAAGVLAGTLLGVLLALNASEIIAASEDLLGLRLFDPSVYYITRVPSLVRAGDVILISGIAFSLSVLSSIYPAWKAASVEAAEVLRYE